MARVIEFEGRQFELPDDASDEEVAQVIGSAPPALPSPADMPALHANNPLGDATTAAAMAPAPARQYASAAPPARNVVTEGLAVASQLPQGVKHGMSKLLGLPVDALNAVGDMGADGIADATNMVLRALGLPEGPQEGARTATPFGGSKSIDAALNAPATAVEKIQDATGVQVFGKPEAPTGPGGRALHRIGEEVGAAAVPAGAAIRAGGKGVEAARKLPALVRSVVEPAAIDAGKFAAKEGTAAFAAGTGAAGVNELTRGAGYKEGSPAHDAGDMAGAFGGVGAAALGGAIMRPLKNVWGAATNNPKFADAVVRDNVADEILRAAGTPGGETADAGKLVDTITNGPKASAAIPGFKESLADRTGSPGIAALEYSRTGGPSSGAYTERRAANTAAVDGAMTKSEPAGETGALRSELEIERTRRLSDADTQTQNAQGALNTHLQRLHPAMTAEGRGADIRTALEGASTETRALVERAWAPLNNSTHMADIGPLADRFAGTTDNLSVAERQRFRPREADIPEQLAGRGEAPEPTPTGILGPDGQPIMRTPEPVDPNVPLNEVTGIRSALTDAAREAATKGRDNEARVINQYIDALDGHLDATVPPDLRGQYDAARAATRDMHDRFSRPQTAIAQTLDRQEGQYRQPDSAVAAKFVQSDEGKIADFGALMREAGNDGRVVPAVRDQMLADVRDRRLLEDPAELEAYIGRYNTLLSEPRFAAVRQELGTAAGLRRALNDATTSEAGLARELGTPDRAGTSTVGQYLRFGDERAEQAMQGVMRSKDPAKAADELLRFVNDDPKAVEGGRKAFWNLMQKSSRSAGETTQSMTGTQPWLPGKLKKFLDENSAVAERLYRDNPEHLENIRKIADTLQVTNTSGRAKAPNSSGTAQIQQSVLPSMETLGSRAFAVERGVVGIPFTVLNLAGIMARRATKGAQASAFHAAMDRALLDPDWAAVLLKENNPANRAAFAKASKTYMGNEASTLTEMLNGSDERDPTKDAIMKKDAK